MARLLFVLLMSFALQARAEDRPPGGEIPSGKWVGFLKPDDRAEAIALTMDSLIIKPPGALDNPMLALVFKLGLGGYGTSEYVSQVFEHPAYDYDQGLLTLDERANEMVVTAFVYAGPTEMKGRVFLRSAAVWADLYLLYQSDEPGEPPPTVEVPPLAPLLAGQYEGTCGEHAAVLQLETARGLRDEMPPLATGLYQYDVSGVLGVANGRCSAVNGAGRPVWCVDHAFSSGTYDFFAGRLHVNGGLETDSCLRAGDELSCTMHMVPPDAHAASTVQTACRFRRTPSDSVPFRSAYRRYRIPVTPEQTAPLPPLNPPFSRELVAALTGPFTGYLHHEASDLYQPLRLNVTASTSTENPHNNNDVFVSVTSALYFGRAISSEFMVQPYERQPSTLSVGYTLKSDDADSFLQITRWTTGLIEGEWYSRQYGRVGTFQVAKGGGLPMISEQARMVPSVVGNVEGPEERRAAGYWALGLMAPSQPRDQDTSFLVLQGNYRLFAGGVGWQTQRISRGAYDFYAGALGWMTDEQDTEGKLVTGTATPEGLRLFWPNDRVFDVGVLQREMGTFRGTAR